MARNLETDPREFYSKYFDTHKYTTELQQHFFVIRKACTRELTAMRKIVGSLHPVPNYLVYGGAVPIQQEKYYYHSEQSSSLVMALIIMRKDGDNDRFTVDANGKIVATGKNALVPNVSTYTPVITTSSVGQLPKNHPSLKLYECTINIAKKVNRGLGSFEFIQLLFAEGVDEKIEDVLSPR